MIDDEIQLFIKDAVASEAARFQTPPPPPQRPTERQETWVKKEEVTQMIETRVNALKINGPSVTGSPRNGWAISAKPGGADDGGGNKRVIIVDNGTANYYDINATFVSAV